MVPHSKKTYYLCGYIIYLQILLNKRQSFFTGDRPYKCEQCPSAFATKSRLRKHVQSHNVTKKNALTCSICFCFLRSTRMLAAHMKQHTDDSEPFKCTICEKKFKNYWYLQNHLKTHSGVKAYSCHMCDKKFASSSHLRRHVKSHSGLKPYVCDLCMRGFPCSQNLKRHMKTHTGEKPHVCSRFLFCSIITLGRAPTKDACLMSGEIPRTLRENRTCSINTARMK